MKAVISVIGKDNFGILAKVSEKCAESRANIVDVTQSVLQDMFVMVMIADISDPKCNIKVLKDKMDELGKELGMKIDVMHEDIFNAMHRI